MSPLAEKRSPLRRFGPSLVRWADSWAPGADEAAKDPKGIDPVRLLPFIVLHASCLLVLVVGWSWVAVGVAAAFYAMRMFAITAFYHRYFSHRAFRTSRPVQFLFALLGVSAVQRGPLWWAAHHRAHHRESDREDDVHSPVRHGFWWSHVGWILANESFRTRVELVPDLARVPELKLLDRFDVFVPLSLYPLFGALGWALERFAPGLGTSPLQMMVWGVSISTVVLYHATFTINSLAHRTGSRRFATRDDSRNNFWLSLITFGEGWHNNHHHYPNSARQGFFWWEVDLTWYGLKVLAALGIVHDLKPVPDHALNRRRIDRGEVDLRGDDAR